MILGNVFIPDHITDLYGNKPMYQRVIALYEIVLKIKYVDSFDFTQTHARA